MIGSFNTYMAVIVFLCILLINAFLTLNWGYDEFGAINSHLELDDQDYIDIYKSYLINLGVSNPDTVDFIVGYILPIIIVPLR